MAGLCKTVSKLYKSFVEWYGENDNEKQQLHDFGKYVVAFLEVRLEYVIKTRVTVALFTSR